MDWSPTSKIWNGKHNVWPHEHCKDWSYCVTIPCWIVQSEAGASSDRTWNPIIFYRVQVVIQSPDGVSSSCAVVRRFSDFLKLSHVLKRDFPRKNIPPAPPKHSLLRVNSSRLLLEKRRCALEEWMESLLSDVDLSRSVPVSAFLNLEAASRPALQAMNICASGTSLSGGINVMNSLLLNRASSASFAADHLTVPLPSVSQLTPSDCGNESSLLGMSPEGEKHNFDTNTKCISDHYMQIMTTDIGLLKDGSNFDCPTEILKNLNHRNLSNESIESGISSTKESGLSISETTRSTGNGSGIVLGGAEAPMLMEAFNRMHMGSLSDVQTVSLEQQHKINRLFVTMQQRLVTAKTDMENLIARLDQEVSVKEYLKRKVEDLEVELEATKQRSRENLLQSIQTERGKVRQVQWDMDELHSKYFETESKLKFEQNERAHAKSEKIIASREKELLPKELDIKQQQLATLQRSIEELKVKSKEDIKLLVKEVKFLRSSQTQLKEALNQYLKEITELEGALQKEKLRWAHANTAKKILLNECRVLRNRFEECSVNFLAQDEDKFSVNSSSLPDALGLLITSDNRIDLLLAEAQLLALNDEHTHVDLDPNQNHVSYEDGVSINCDDLNTMDEKIRKMLVDVFMDNARLRKQVNFITRAALRTAIKPEKEGNSEVTCRSSVLSRFLQR